MMHGQRLRVLGLAVCFAGLISALVRAEGAEEALTRQGVSRLSQDKLIVSDALDTMRRPDAAQIPYVPLDPQTQFKRVVVGGDGAAGEAGAGERLVYQNTEGRFVLQLRSGRQISDDLTLNAARGCELRRYKFRIFGRVNPGGLGGPYRVNFALYTTCPQAGGSVITGTSGQMDFPDDAPREVEVVLPDGVVTSRTTVWLGVRFDRDNCGVVMGAPALRGFSGDIFDFPQLSCSANLGGFPGFPHGSIIAEVFASADECGSGFAAYRNINPGQPGINRGRNVEFADDITLNTPVCDLIGYEIGVKGQAFYQTALYRDSAGLPGTELEGAAGEILHQSNNALIRRVEIDPPIRVSGADGARLWVSVSPNTQTGGWIRTGTNASVGNTFATFAERTASGWVIRNEQEGFHGGYYAVAICAGDPPLGACCDMFVTDSAGEAVCRDVPKMNCPFPPPGSALRPRWEPGRFCRSCNGGCRDGEACTDDADCVGAATAFCANNVCVEGCNLGAPCTEATVEVDCGVATDGVCEANEPFVRPCGESACCGPQGDCQNLTRNECNALEPLFRPRQWQRGSFCGVLPQRCPDIACLERTGDCREARELTCNGGTNDGAPCNGDAGCRGFCQVPPGECVGGCNDGRPCSSNAQCNCDGVCNDSDPNDPRCVGGTRDGEFCDPDLGDRDCFESFCERFPGCDPPLCCSSVCDFAPGPPLFTELCCSFNWDETCASVARGDFGKIFDCEGILLENDECAPNDRIAGAQSVPISANATTGRDATDNFTDPGVCCHTGSFVCDGGAADGQPCNVNIQCVGASDGFCDQDTGSCTGGCNEGANCENDEQCLGCPDGECVSSGPRPGARASGTWWYAVRIPEATSPEEPETVALRFETCQTPNPNESDSVLQVFSLADSDRGLCTDLGRCASDRTACRLGGSDCAGGQACVVADVVCSVSAQDCPLEAECELDLVGACNPATSLSLVACSDDAADACGQPGTRDRLSRTCVPDLQRGETYIVMVGWKDDRHEKQYRFDVTPVGSCPGTDAPANDFCRNAQRLSFHRSLELSVPFDLSNASFECQPSVGLSTGCSTMQNDIWFEYRPEFNGHVTFESCGADAESTPDTCLAIYDGCDCPPENDPALACSCLNLGDQACLEGARVATDVIGGNCYTVRLSDNRGTRGAANLNYQFDEADCNANGIPDNCDISCGEAGGPCDIPGCGTLEDCTGNSLPDDCDILVTQGGFCDPEDRNDCSEDQNGDGRPDECPNCPVGAIDAVDPPNGAVVAGYPADPISCAAAGVSQIVVQGPPGAGDERRCWSLCETNGIGGGANFVSVVSEATPGDYVVTLGRPLSAGGCTTLSYTDNSGVRSTVSVTKQPGDVNGDGTTNSGDLAFMLDVMTGVDTAPWGFYSTDIDLTGSFSSADLLGLIDLLAGNGPCFEPWDGTSATSCDDCPEN